MGSVDECRSAIFTLPNESIIYDVLNDVHKVYKPIHTYMSIVLCAIGAVCNFCNIVVLTRKNLRSPVNIILTAMACCDTCVLFSNLIYTTHFTFVAYTNCHPRHWSYGWAQFLIAHAHISLIGHTSSVWLSVMLALIRYLTLRSRGKVSSIQIGSKHSYIAIASVIICVLMLNLPNFLSYRIIERKLEEVCDVTDKSIKNGLAYFPFISDLAKQNNCLIFNSAFWISGLAFKLLPCILLSLFVWLLTRILNEVKQNRMRLLKGSTRNLVQPNINGIIDVPVPRKESRNSLANIAQPPQHSRTGSVKGGNYRGRADRTTRMLLTIVCVFLITELPQGIMAVLIGILSYEFHEYIYRNVGDILDLLSLCEACTSFIIYCSMSGQFRNEFRRVFIPSQVNCWLSPESARRYSDALFNKTTNTHFLQIDNGHVNDRSVTISLVDSTVRRMSTDESPRNDSSEFHRRSTQALLSDNSSLLVDTGSTRNNHIEDDSSPLLKPCDNKTRQRHVDSSLSSSSLHNNDNNNTC